MWLANYLRRFSSGLGGPFARDALETECGLRPRVVCSCSASRCRRQEWSTRPGCSIIPTRRWHCRLTSGATHRNSGLPRPNREHVAVPDVRIKRMKTLSGSCNAAARQIWLNLELAKKPAACLEYILVHEMVHLLERHHDERFRERIDSLMPCGVITAMN